MQAANSIATSRLQKIEHLYKKQKLFTADWKRVWLQTQKSSLLYQIFARQLDDIYNNNTSQPLSVGYLSEAALKTAVLQKSECGTFVGTIGLMPGSFDPAHFGHISTALAAIEDLRLNGVIMAIGGRVPEKPEITSFPHRRNMMTCYTDDIWGKWIRATSVRDDMIDLFKNAAWLPKQEDQADKTRVNPSSLHKRNITDIAAFSFLFAMNPGVRWVYITGSDKINKYGTENEEQLVYHTLYKNGIRVYYGLRETMPIDMKAIGSRPWLQDLWNEGMFINESQPSLVATSSGLVRQKIAEKDSSVVSDIHLDILSYITAHKINKLYSLRNQKRIHAAIKDSTEYEKQLASFRTMKLLDGP